MIYSHSDVKQDKTKKNELITEATFDFFNARKIEVVPRRVKKISLCDVIEIERSMGSKETSKAIKNEYFF